MSEEYLRNEVKHQDEIIDIINNLKDKIIVHEINRRVQLKKSIARCDECNEVLEEKQKVCYPCFIENMDEETMFDVFKKIANENMIGNFLRRYDIEKRSMSSHTA